MLTQDLSPTLSVHAPSSMSALLALLLAHPKPKPTAVRPSAVLANATTAPPRPAVAAPAPGFRVIRPQPGAPSSDEMQLDDQPAAQQPGDSFITARAQLVHQRRSLRLLIAHRRSLQTIDRVKLNGGGNNSHSNMNGSSYSRKTLGAKGPPPSSSSSSSSLSNGQSGGGLTKKFVSPLLKKDGNESDSDSVRRDVGCYSMNGKKPSATPSGTKKPEITDERLKNIEPQMVEMIMNEVSLGFTHSRFISFGSHSTIDAGSVAAGRVGGHCRPRARQKVDQGNCRLANAPTVRRFPSFFTPLSIHGSCRLSAIYLRGSVAHPRASCYLVLRGRARR